MKATRRRPHQTTTKTTTTRSRGVQTARGDQQLPTPSSEDWTGRMTPGSQRAEAESSDADYATHLSGEEFLVSSAPPVTPAETVESSSDISSVSSSSAGGEESSTAPSWRVANELKRLGNHWGEPNKCEAEPDARRKTASTGWRAALNFCFCAKERGGHHGACGCVGIATTLREAYC